MPERSKVWIDATSSVHGIHSESQGLRGWFEAAVDEAGEIDLSVPPEAHIEFPIDDMSSGNVFYDKEMQRRVDSRRHPTISGDLTELERAGTDGRYLARGSVTFRGVTQPMEGDLTIATHGARAIRISGERMFDIREFGMRPPRILMLRVHPEVAVRIDVVAEQEE